MAPKSSTTKSSTNHTTAKKPTKSSAKPATATATASALSPALPPAPQHYHLSPAREAELTREAESLGDALLLFPGKLARRVIWSSRIQLAAERDAEDLLKTPFADDEPPLTLSEIHGLRDKIEFLRVTQSRWQASQQSQQKAAANFEKPAAEAGQHRQTLLRFFDLRFKKNPEGQKRLSMIRAGSGDADLVQDVSDVLVLCAEHTAAINKGPRGEATAAARLAELSPLLSRLLADKTLSPEAQRARKLRDAAYTLVMNAERRLRAAAEYWYDGTDKVKDYGIFPTPAGASTSASSGEEQDEETEQPVEGDDTVNDVAPE